MLRALYCAATGMVKDQYRQDVVSNNIANADTNGYKRDVAVTATFDSLLIRRENDYYGPEYLQVDPRPPIGLTNFGVWVDTVSTIHETGALRETGSQLDMAVVGEGYFVVQTPQGTMYSRDGAAALTPEGYLTDDRGHYIMGETGPIQLALGEFAVSPDGSIYQEGALVDRIQLVTFTDMNSFLKVGDNYYRTMEAPQQAANPNIRQGYLENSNVNIVREMVEMITVMRSYEANQKTIQSLDGTLDKAVNEIGRV